MTIVRKHKDNCSATSFDGWDWRELATAWNIYIPESYAGKDMYDFSEKMRLTPSKECAVCLGNKDIQAVFDDIDWSINDYERFDEWEPVVWYINIAMKKYIYGEGNRIIRKMANDVRCFSKELSKSKHSYYTPLWEGLSKIEDDETLLRIISGNYPLIATMWD